MAHVLAFERPVVELVTRVRELRELASSDERFGPELKRLEDKAAKLAREVFAKLSPMQKVQLSRHPSRPYTLNYVERLFTDFIELHGDRRFADDPAIVAGIGRYRGRSVAIVGHQKGRTTKENMQRNFGMPNPEGYRKAIRVYELAERFGLPILTFVDTTGAYCGIGAEERGQSAAIGEAIEVMARVGVPIVTTVIGEGGSGGALALGVAAHCDGCIGFHTQALARLRATREEIEETLGMAVYMGGGPALMYAADAIAAFEQFEGEQVTAA